MNLFDAPLRLPLYTISGIAYQLTYAHLIGVRDLMSEVPSPAAVPGTVYLVGAGPGDPGLLTRRGLELLQSCTTLVYDALVSPETLALVPPACEQIFAGKRGKSHFMEQDDINALLADKALAGQAVVRLKGGDPYLFGRGGEEALYLVERGVPFEIVPGVTSGLAAPAYAGIPVTHRGHGSAVTLVTGHEDPTKPESALDWAALAKIGTLCFYMGVKNLERISSNLLPYLPGTTPAAVIQWGTTPRQRCVSGTLADIAEKAAVAGIEAPALTVIGGVAGLRPKLNFFESRPLFGKRIVVTRSRAQQSGLADKMRRLGAATLSFPTIKIGPAPDATVFSTAVANLASYDWLILTSINGTDALFAELERQGKDARAFGSAKVAVVGASTREHLHKHGIRADLQPPKYESRQIIESLRTTGILGATPKPGAPLKFLMLRSDLANSDLPKKLQELGASVTDVVAYRTELDTSGQDAALEALVQGDVDAVTFTSASTARNFVEILGPERLKTCLASTRLRFFSIGPVTSQAMRNLGLPRHGEAPEQDITGLTKLILEHCAKKNS